MRNHSAKPYQISLFTGIIVQWATTVDCVVVEGLPGLQNRALVQTPSQWLLGVGDVANMYDELNRQSVDIAMDSLLDNAGTWLPRKARKTMGFSVTPLLLKVDREAITRKCIGSVY